MNCIFIHRNSSSRERSEPNRDRDRERFDRFERREGREDRSQDRQRAVISKRSFSRENEERSRGGDHRGPADAVRRVASMTDDRDRGSRDRGSRERGSMDRGSRDRGSRDRGSHNRDRSKDSGEECSVTLVIYRCMSWDCTLGSRQQY